jgi:valyl-tRNA synthetase
MEIISRIGASPVSSGGAIGFLHIIAMTAAVVIVSKEPVTVCPKCGKNIYQQDPDTLDTWFSSALWPFSTMGWLRILRS